MRINFESLEAVGLRLAWPFFLRMPSRPQPAPKAPKILTREELKELFSSELSQAEAEGSDRRQRPMGMSGAGRLRA